MLKSPDRPSDASRSMAEFPPAGWGAVFSALGDAVALVDRAAQRLCWTSRDWQVQRPGLRAGSTLAELEQALPGLGVAARAAEPNTAGAPRRLSVGPAGEWEAEIADLDPATLLLRLADRREQSRAVQRQLDDREQLLFTSRVISVGEMASTLAHELNQPIGAAANLMRGLRKRLARCGSGLAAEESEALDRAIDQVMFASRIIARIREFTHSHQPRQARVDFSSLLRSSASLLDWDLRRTGARLALEMPDAPVLVRGDAVMLQQVIVNLMRNALDALRTDPPEDPRLTLRLFAGAKEVELQVSDNGCGLADEVAARMFVPFASSKPNGMGLGLSICRSFVELHRGRLWFSRHADRGVTFHLGLPPLAAGPASH